ncbi:hydrogenase expression/formation C-terminal domain-containing protein [Sedimenticola thiotaurini]|uniref:HupH hydrogenase expression protein C-terminal domain-containing protein n=1 Tax=Sedimenticola thiotaurini TaxID=1543721 RepID=A0A0F7JVV2_9GAMM|nr:hydrogenase expression/formation C-terminal domain-containing protein [Sedimenticola thiotaurini]AKH19519.1 hypothetical protein AAY24_03180 [Sedimenticola thiotaurini]
MSALDQTDSSSVSASGNAELTHNTLPLLNEVRHALKRLVRTGESTIIDLRAIPFGPGDEERLLDLLGQGEVQATLDSLGRTSIKESRFSGVWIVDHYNSEDERIAFQIEVIDIPDLLRAQADDMSQSLDKLATLLEDELQGTE